MEDTIKDGGCQVSKGGNVFAFMMYQALGGGKGKNIYMGKVFPTIFYTMKYDCKKLSQLLGGF